MSTRHVMHLYKIKSNALRRLVVSLTFPLLMMANLLLWVIGSIVFSYKNQVDLCKSAIHYWKTPEEIDHSGGGE